MLNHVWDIEDKKLYIDGDSVSLFELDKIAFNIFQFGIDYVIENWDNNEIRNKISEIYNITKNLSSVNSEDVFKTKIENRIDLTNISSFSLYISEDCNLNCKYCWNLGGRFQRNNGRLFSNDLIEYFTDLLKENKNDQISIDFFGGEPLLNFDLIKNLINRNIKINKNKKINYILTTNGTLYSKEVSKFLKESNVDIIFSLDGPEDYHNKYRKYKNNLGSFSDVIKGIDIYNNIYGHKPTIRPTWTFDKKFTLKKIYEWFEKNDFKLIEFEPNFRFFNKFINEKDINEVINQKKDFLNYIFNNIKYNLNNKKKRNVYYTWIKFISRILTKKNIFGCSLFKRDDICIGANGDLFFCLALPYKEYKLGNLKNSEKILNISNYSFIYKNVDQRDKCKFCWAKYICGGGCYGTNYQLSGDPLKPSDKYCLFQKKLFEVDLYFILKMKVEMPVFFQKLKKLDELI